MNGQKGQWGLVCKYGFKDKEASVVCNQLNKGTNKCGRNGKVVDVHQFGQDATTKLWLDKIQCEGSEQCLDECEHAPWGAAYCNKKSVVVGINCT